MSWFLTTTAGGTGRATLGAPAASTEDGAAVEDDLRAATSITNSKMTTGSLRRRKMMRLMYRHPRSNDDGAAVCCDSNSYEDEVGAAECHQDDIEEEDEVEEIATTAARCRGSGSRHGHDDDDVETALGSTVSKLEHLVSHSPMMRTKSRVRALVQSFALIGVVTVYAVYNHVVVTPYGDHAAGSSSHQQLDQHEQHAHQQYDRYLQVEPTSSTCGDIAEPKWFLTWYIIGVLYMFLALAIACDEFFVPALEEMASSRRLNLSMDVAGATLMAAGGSAPELFSSLFGTFAESEIGFGTIIGSAVFNVLFVIAMCSFFSNDVLQLTWWPLFRDSLCYAIGLVVLTIFIGVVSPNQIFLWEAIVLFVMYLAYCLIMWQNRNIYKALTGKELPPDEDESDSGDDDGKDKEGKQDNIVVEAEQAAPAMNGTASADNNEESKDEENVEVEMKNDVDNQDNGDEKEENGVDAVDEGDKPPSTGQLAHVTLDAMHHHPKQGGHEHIDFRWQGTFRAGILKMLRDPNTWVEMGGVGIVAKISGDADYVFRQIDANGDGELDKEELKQLFVMLDYKLSDFEMDEVFKALDLDSDGAISEEEFNKWYTNSAELIRSQVRHVFDELDTDNSGTIDKTELKVLLKELDPHVTDEDVQAAHESMYLHGSTEEITFDEFEEWYEKSMIYERQRKAVEEDMEGVWESLKPPFGESVFAWLQYIIIFPLVFAMAITIPDVRRPGWGRWCYVSFFISIGWIGAMSYLMVTWTEIIGNTIGIPSVVMGLTVLAAGTSVPDLLSSVIVARRGQGDMAVSSSIGSNIFDILVGLPIPWILFTLVRSKPIEIGTKNMFISISVLLGMLVFVIVAVHCQGWKLTKTLGVLMLIFYVGFLAQAIILELPFEACTPAP